MRVRNFLITFTVCFFLNNFVCKIFKYFFFFFSGDLSSINDVDSADYTGFSLLGEDLLGDLFGSSGSKKTNKNKKKQAPAPTTTTTRRPRPSRRPSRRPVRTTTPKPTRLTTTTTLKERPVTRRPTRKPVRRRRPTRKPTTTSITAESPSSTTITTPSPLVVVPVVTTAPVIIPSTERSQPIEIETDQTFEPIIGINQKVEPIMYSTTAKTVTDFEDPGLKISLAHITGQLSNMPATPIVSNTAKESSVASTNAVNYEKIETITPKMPTTISFPTTSEEKVNDDLIQIVQDLDSHSEESNAHKESLTAEETRSHIFDEIAVATEQSEVVLPKKKHRSSFDFGDLDVLHLTEIGETVGDELGIFGKNKRGNKNNKPQKQRDGKKEDDYSELLGLDNLESLLRKSSDSKIKKDRRRQNKMMRGEWSQV